MASTIKALYLGDSHCPFQDKKSVEWACKQIAKFKPDYLIFGGDLFEADAASRFDNEYDHDFRDEQHAAAALLDQLAGAGGGAQLVWSLGNHDQNVRNPGRVGRRLRRSIDWNNCEWRDSFKAWRQIPYDFSPDGTFQLGQVIFWHGHGGLEDTNAIKLNNACGGFAHRLVVGGHTHTPHGPTQVMKTKTLPLPLWYANGGTLGPLRPGWTQRQDTSRWAAAVVKVELKMGRACQPGKNWDCVVEKMK